jgi:hypothetical protein
MQLITRTHTQINLAVAFRREIEKRNLPLRLMKAPKSAQSPRLKSGRQHVQLKQLVYAVSSIYMPLLIISRRRYRGNLTTARIFMWRKVTELGLS